jgi:hypothetical protein
MVHQKESPRRLQPLGLLLPVQLRFEPKLTLDEYISQEAWVSATLLRCPIDGEGCRPRRHGCYWRKFPSPIPIARFYCPRARTTFSLLPDCLSSRYRGELGEFEQVCANAETRDALSICNEIRPVENAVSISARSAARWVGRRCALFGIILRALLGVAVERVQGVRTASQLRERLQCRQALVELRGIVTANLGSLPPPLGFGPWPKLTRAAQLRAPHAMAPEPEPPSG